MFDELLDDEIEQLDDDTDVALGIDLGTTNSVAALVIEGKVEVLVNREGRTLTPSVVAWLPNGERQVGAAARARQVIDPRNTVYSAKRLIGQPFRAERVQTAISQLPYQVIEGEQEEPLIVTRDGNLPIPQISAYVLAQLRELAQARLKRPVNHCVVTVPANFSDAQRAATRRAAQLAGMEVLRILNEPTAAAVAYGRGRSVHQRIAVFDLGGGTFDVTVLAVRDNLYEVIATGGDPFLGGDDFDEMISRRLAFQLLQQHRYDANTDPIARAKLAAAAEQIKQRLSQDATVSGTLNDIAYGHGRALALQFRVERSDFERDISTLVERAISVTERVLLDAHISPDQIDEVILVGGSTRIPIVQRRVAECFKQQPRCTLDPMEVVAMGAAQQAKALTAPDADEAPVLLDVAPHSLRVATVGGFTKVLIPRNSTIPAEGTSTFFTARDNQSAVKIQVCQGENDAFQDNVPLGEIVLDGIPPARRGEIPIAVAFTIDANGILQVSATETRTGQARRATLSMIGFKEQR